jgi:excisionase family DNA binding protein
MMPADRSEAIRSAVDALVAALVAAATPEPADAPERLHDVGSAAALLGIGRSALYVEMQAGRLRSLSIGRRRLIPASAIRDYIRSDSKAELAATADHSPAGGPLLHETAANFDAAQAGDPPMGVSPTPSPAIERATVPPAGRRSVSK